MQVALLTIGTEITSGEITNTNSVWMSQQLEGLGFAVAAQLSVPDDPKLIQWALSSLAQQSEILFITGGLGPTSDDITRQEIAKWCDRALVFDATVWQALADRFAARGVPIRESHKQQCYFQEGAVLLKNSTGTALGFYIVQDQASAGPRPSVGPELHIFVMPGPPRELEPMWQNEVLLRVELFPRTRDYAIRRWIVTDVPESEVAEVVEEVMKGCDVVLGYRASKPTVRVKVRFRLSDKAVQPKLEELHRRLMMWSAQVG